MFNWNPYQLVDISETQGIHLHRLPEVCRLTRKEAELERFWWQGSLSLCLSSQPPRSLAKLTWGPLEATPHTWNGHAHAFPFAPSDTHSSSGKYIKPFNCKLFHAGDNPWAFPYSRDIFCGQLGDESLREKHCNRTSQKEEKHENKQDRSFTFASRRVNCNGFVNYTGSLCQFEFITWISDMGS